MLSVVNKCVLCLRPVIPTPPRTPMRLHLTRGRRHPSSMVDLMGIKRLALKPVKHSPRKQPKLAQLFRLVGVCISTRCLVRPLIYNWNDDVWTFFFFLCLPGRPGFLSPSSSFRSKTFLFHGQREILSCSGTFVILAKVFVYFCQHTFKSEIMLI